MKANLRIKNSVREIAQRAILGVLAAVILGGVALTSTPAQAKDRRTIVDVIGIIDDRDRDPRDYDRGRDYDRDRDRRDRDRRRDRDYDRRPPPSYGNLICSASDRGFEEHLSGHRDCRSCLRSHDRCIETCEEQTYVCSGVGTNRYGRSVDIVGVGATRFEAQNEIEDECYYSRLANCRILRCDIDRRAVSQRACR